MIETTEAKSKPRGAHRRWPADERVDRTISMPKALFQVIRELSEVLEMPVNTLIVGLLLFGADYLVKLSTGDSPAELHAAYQVLMPDPEHFRETA